MKELDHNFPGKLLPIEFHFRLNCSLSEGDLCKGIEWIDTYHLRKNPRDMWNIICNHYNSASIKLVLLLPPCIVVGSSQWPECWFLVSVWLPTPLQPLEQNPVAPYKVGGAHCRQCLLYSVDLSPPYTQHSLGVSEVLWRWNHQLLWFSTCCTPGVFTLACTVSSRSLIWTFWSLILLWTAYFRWALNPISLIFERTIASVSLSLHRLVQSSIESSTACPCGWL